MEVKANLLIDKIYGHITNRYLSLFDKGREQGHWNDERSTAMAGLCLAIKEDHSSNWVASAVEHICNRQIQSGDTKGSWSEEVWDTSLSIFFLKEVGLTNENEVIKTGLNWLISRYSLNNRKNWHDEPWETSWGLLAAIRCSATSRVDIVASLTWLASLQDDEGAIIAPIYTAYFLLLVYHASRYVSKDLGKTFKHNVDKGVTYLMNQLVASDRAILWGGEGWVNGQILWALSISDSRLPFDLDLVGRVVDWFVSHKSEGYLNDDVEDISSTILGFYHLQQRLLIIYKNIDTIEARLVIKKTINWGAPAPVLITKVPLLERKIPGYLTINIKRNTVKKLKYFSYLAAMLIVVWIGRLLDFFDRVKNYFPRLFN
jgi:hypothetical protein